MSVHSAPPIRVSLCYSGLPWMPWDSGPRSTSWFVFDRSLHWFRWRRVMPVDLLDGRGFACVPVFTGPLPQRACRTSPTSIRFVFDAESDRRLDAVERLRAEPTGRASCSPWCETRLSRRSGRNVGRPADRCRAPPLSRPAAPAEFAPTVRVGRPCREMTFFSDHGCLHARSSMHSKAVERGVDDDGHGGRRPHPVGSIRA